jgi:hypothetical protein
MKRAIKSVRAVEAFGRMRLFVLHDLQMMHNPG